ncbi:hypothetical protein OH491_24915 [Termitidicoccus mucosus]|uniref:Uncharacterized protein n=1 Tax=Termitidicoccus mucosus TaxID=1184151 RepID=A0A178IR67_9BACT|nr:hypothetical protein AW736_01620 [Opitutaceae bacterium TSB47]
MSLFSKFSGHTVRFPAFPSACNNPKTFCKWTRAPEYVRSAVQSRASMSEAWEQSSDPELLARIILLSGHKYLLHELSLWVLECIRDPSLPLPPCSHCRKAIQAASRHARSGGKTTANLDPIRHDILRHACTGRTGDPATACARLAVVHATKINQPESWLIALAEIKTAATANASSGYAAGLKQSIHRRHLALFRRRFNNPFLKPELDFRQKFRSLILRFHAGHRLSPVQFCEKFRLDETTRDFLLRHDSMMEAWDNAHTPQILAHILARLRQAPDPELLRRFACQCIRSSPDREPAAWELLESVACRQTVEIAELFSFGVCPPAEFINARQIIIQFCRARAKNKTTPESLAARAVFHAAAPVMDMATALHAARRSIDAVKLHCFLHARPPGIASAFKQHQAGLFRNLIANPFAG